MEIKRKLYLTIAFWMAVFAAFSLFLIYPFYSEITELSGFFIATKEDMAALEAKKRYAKDFEENLKNLSEEIGEIESAAVPKKDVVAAIEFLEKTASGSKINIEVKSVEIPEKDNFVIFKISLLGDFGDIFRFVKILENGGYFVSFGNFVFRRLEKISFDAAKMKIPVGEGAVSADLEISFFAR